MVLKLSHASESSEELVKNTHTHRGYCCLFRFSDSVDLGQDSKNKNF